MRWTIAAACVSTFVLGVVILAATPGFEHVPPGGRAIPYLGIMLSWGFVAVGSYAWLRRPDNRTGALMTILGVGVGVTGLSLFDVPALWALGAMADTVIVSVLVHLLLAFPSGRLETRSARVVVAIAYAAGALQPALVLFTRCEEEGCPDNPILIADNATIADVIAVVQAIFAVVSVGLTVVLLLRRWRESNPAQRRGLEPVLLLGAVILVLGLATAATQIAGVAPKTQIAFVAGFALLPPRSARLAHPVLPTATVTRLIEQLRAPATVPGARRRARRRDPRRGAASRRATRIDRRLWPPLRRRAQRLSR